MTITINDVQYNETKFNDKLKTYLIARQEIQQSKARHLVEIEKIDVLTNYYDGKITEELNNTDEAKALSTNK